MPIGPGAHARPWNNVYPYPRIASCGSKHKQSRHAFLSGGFLGHRSSALPIIATRLGLPLYRPAPCFTLSTRPTYTGLHSRGNVAGSARLAPLYYLPRRAGGEIHIGFGSTTFENDRGSSHQQQAVLGTVAPNKEPLISLGPRPRNFGGT